MIEKYTLALISFLGITLSQIILSSLEDCTCNQIINENECQYMSPYCYWDGFQCSLATCQNNSKVDCAQLDQCYTDGQGCYQFYQNETCQNFNNTNHSCQKFSKNCFDTPSGICSDINQQLLPSCSNYLKLNECSKSLQGICTWYNGTCNYFSNCSSVPLSICQSYQPIQTKDQQGMYCVVNNSQCVQATCNLISNKKQCTYIQTFFDRDEFMLCQWNSTSKQCQMATSTNFLTNTTCLSSTMGNYHWVTKNNYTTEGYCFKCQIKQIYTKNTCSCEQLISEYDCYKNELCQWNNQCVTKSCNALNTSQEYCVLNPNCAWIQGTCTSFTKCENLNGTNQYECLLQSLQCASSNGYQCLPIGQLNEYGCVSNAYGQCERLITNHGFCVQGYNNQSGGSQTCRYTNYLDCQDIYSYQECKKLSHTCYWQTHYYNQQYCQLCSPQNYYYCEYCGGICYSLSCYNYRNELDCTFIYQWGEVRKCQWYPNQNSCDYAYDNNNNNYYSNVAPLNQDQCYSKTYGQYRWSSKEGKVGECLKCSIVYLPKKKNQCTCQDLIYQGDCALAGESCLWNTQLSQCVQIDCRLLKSRSSCISNYDCHWIQVNDVMQCLPLTKCSNLPGSNSYQCLAYSYRCTKSDGKFCQELSRSDISNKCSSISNYTSCYLTIGSDGICAWNGQSCYALSECSQIPQSSLCGINNYACQWNYNTNQCQPLQCSNILTESDCTYVDATINRQPTIQMCYWVNQKCQNVTSASDTLSSTNCYINSGRTYSWSENNSTSGHCESCSYNYLIRATILVILLLMNN